MTTVEEAIKQTKPMNPWQRGLVNILLTHNLINARLSDFLDQAGITQSQFNALRILRGQYPTPCGNWLIKERLLQKNTDITRLIDRLVEKDLVTRVQGKEDRRCVEIMISDKGLELLATIDAQSEQIKSFMGNISEAEANELNRILDKIRG
jgi:DNA-binding MarR family transcriptional regulator